MGLNREYFDPLTRRRNFVISIGRQFNLLQFVIVCNRKVRGHRDAVNLDFKCLSHKPRCASEIGCRFQRELKRAVFSIIVTANNRDFGIHKFRVISRIKYANSLPLQETFAKPALHVTGSFGADQSIGTIDNCMCDRASPNIGLDQTRQNYAVRNFNTWSR